MFTFVAYKEHLLHQGVQLNASKKMMNNMPPQLCDLYDSFNGMLEGFTATENLIEIYPIERAETVTKAQIKKYPHLQEKLVLIFGDVLLESHFLTIQKGQPNPQFLFGDEFINISPDASELTEVWSELFSFKES